MLNYTDLTDILMGHVDEGYSVDVHGNVPTDGYMVGGETPSLILKQGVRGRYLTTDAWLDQEWDVLTQPGYFAGIWTDTDTGDVYVDISRNVTDLYAALAIAEARGELAIWDVASAKEVRVGFDA